MSSCTFCHIVEKKEPAHIVYEDINYLAFLDTYPQSRGHLQLIPKTHYQWIYEIPEIGQFFSVAGRIIRAIIPALGADHVTIATFGRQVAHAHLWIVPQYRDTQTIKEGSGQLTKEKTLQEVAEIIGKALEGA